MEIALSNTNKLVLVDDELYFFLNKYTWCLHNGGYAVGRIMGKLVLMHRFITDTYQENFVVDHINANKLDNRRCNLRVCLHQENCFNTQIRKNTITGYKGVSLDKRDGTYCAKININGISKVLGYTKDPILAAKIYDEVARFHFGEFACTNFSGTTKCSADEMIIRTRKNRGLTSKYRGVYFSKQAQKYLATVSYTKNGKRFKKYAGRFSNEKEAAKAYNQLAIEIFGKKAILNREV